MTDKQAAILLALSDRRGSLTTSELTMLVNDVHNDDDWPEIPTLTKAQVRTVGQQLARQGVVSEESYLTAEKKWSITDVGRRRADAYRGVVG